MLGPHPYTLLIDTHARNYTKTNTEETRARTVLDKKVLNTGLLSPSIAQGRKIEGMGWGGG